MNNLQDFSHRHQQRDLRQDPERGQLVSGDVAVGLVHRDGRLRDFPLSVHNSAANLCYICAQEPFPFLVGLIPVLDDRIRYGFHVSTYTI